MSNLQANQTEKDVRILIVDDQWLIREGLASLLEIEDGFIIAGTASDGEEAIKLAQIVQPTIVLMDIRMPNMSGIEATAQIRQNHPDCQVLMLTTFDDEEYVVQSLLAGACGYLMKDVPAAHLVQAIRLAHAGIFQLAPEVAGKLVGSIRQPATKMVKMENIPLTPRELEILNLLANGATNREIAEKLVVSEGTVKNHVSNILQSLNLRDRTQAAVFAVRNGIA